MKKTSKFLMIFVVGILSVFLGAVFLVPKTNDSPIPDTEVPTSSTSLISQSSIFKEITNDGLASFLEISIPETPTNLSSIKITQTIGAVANTPAEDEKGTTCYYSNALGSSKQTTFYFTRPATYTVQYVTGSNGTVVSETCTFTPSINKNILSNVYTSTDGGETKSNLVSAGSKDFILASGNLFIPQDTLGLYSVSAYINGTEKSSFLNTIPDNSFGTVTYKIVSNNGHTSLTQDVIILTTDFDINFLKNGSIIDKADYLYNGGYVFNSGIDFEITVDATAKSIATDDLLTDEEKLAIFDLLDFKLECRTKDSTNTSVTGSEIVQMEEPTTTPTLTHHLDAVDHTIYKVVTTIKDTNSSTYTYSNNLLNFKIITKVPQNDQGRNLFSIVLEQMPYDSTNDYLDEILNKYLPEGSIIYYPTNQVRLYYHGYSTTSTRLAYSTSSTVAYLPQGGEHDFSDNGSTITVNNETLSFDDFFIFSFTIKTYSGSSNFIDTMLRNNMFYNSSVRVEDDHSDCVNTIQSTVPINNFKYVIPSNYSTECIPLHIRVTYNGTSFEDICNFQSNDQLLFTAYGDYSVEFYNLPNYEFLMNNINSLSETYYYYKLDFVIAGPSIYASSTDSNGKTLTLSNRMYTQNPASIKVSLNAGQQLVIYLNGDEYARRDASIDFNLSTIGTWKISIIDADNNELKSLTFTIADNVYQGFSINNYEEFENLSVGTQISSMPVIYSPMEEASAYHLTHAGTYRIKIDAKETLSFSVNGAQSTAYTINSNAIVIQIQKSYFTLSFSNGPSGTRTSSKVIVSDVAGVELQTLEVYRNNKLVKTFTADELADWDTITEANRSFSDNGTYTFKLTDKFGNTYEAQMRKYYKVNVALVFLILIAVAGLIVLFVTIVKARHKIKVK